VSRADGGEGWTPELVRTLMPPLLGRLAVVLAPDGAPTFSIKAKVSKQKLEVIQAKRVRRREVLQMGVTLPVDGTRLPMLAQIEREVKGDGSDGDRVFVTVYEPATSAAAELLLKGVEVAALTDGETMEGIDDEAGGDTKWLFLLSELVATREPEFGIALSARSQQAVKLRAAFARRGAEERAKAEISGRVFQTLEDDGRADTLSGDALRALMDDLGWDLSLPEALPLLGRGGRDGVIEGEGEGSRDAAVAHHAGDDAQSHPAGDGEGDERFTFADVERLDKKRAKYCRKRHKRETAMALRRSECANAKQGALPTDPSWLAPRFFLRLNKHGLRTGYPPFRRRERDMLLGRRTRDPALEKKKREEAEAAKRAAEVEAARVAEQKREDDLDRLDELGEEDRRDADSEPKVDASGNDIQADNKPAAKTDTQNEAAGDNEESGKEDPVIRGPLCICGATKEVLDDAEHFWHAELADLVPGSLKREYFLSEDAFEDRFPDAAHRFEREHFVRCTLDEVLRYSPSVGVIAQDRAGRIECRDTGVDLTALDQREEVFHAFMAGGESYLLSRAAFASRFGVA
jgi:hypothetical protein